MDNPDFSDFQRINPLQRIVGFIASFACCSAIIMAGTGTITEQELTRTLLIGGLGGYFLYWLLGALPKILNKSFSLLFWAIGQSFVAMGNGVKYGFSKIHFKPKKTEFRWLKYLGIGVLITTFFSAFNALSMYQCLWLSVQGVEIKKAGFYCDIVANTGFIKDPVTVWMTQQFFKHELLVIPFLLAGFILLYLGTKPRTKPSGYKKSSSSTHRERAQDHSYNDDEFTQNSTADEDHQDPYGDWRFSGKRFKNKFQSQVMRSADPSASPSERRMSSNWVQVANTKGQKGIKPLPKI